MTELAPVLGVLAVLVGIADTIPYVRDIRRGVTRPHRGTWLIWSTLTIVVVLSQHADGASWSVLMAASQALLTTLIFVLSIRRGEGCLCAGEWLMISVASVGVFGWIVADEPVIATGCVVLADLMGAALMAPKAYRDPHSETLSTFALASLGGAPDRGRGRRAATGAAALPGLFLPGKRRIGAAAVAAAGGARIALSAHFSPRNALALSSGHAEHPPPGVRGGGAARGLPRPPRPHGI